MPRHDDIPPKRHRITICVAACGAFQILRPVVLRVLALKVLQELHKTALDRIDAVHGDNWCAVCAVQRFAANGTVAIQIPASAAAARVYWLVVWIIQPNSMKPQICHQCRKSAVVTRFPARSREKYHELIAPRHCAIDKRIVVVEVSIYAAIGCFWGDVVDLYLGLHLCKSTNAPEHKE